MRLPVNFYKKNTLKVAQGLLGQILCRKMKIGDNTVKKNVLRGIISEVEAYVGEDDPACHAACGKTKRNEVMFGPAGHAYVYFIYGMYHCLNIVTEKENYPAAVLIRGVYPIKGSKIDLKNLGKEIDGPGKLCNFFKIDKKLNGADVVKGKKLWVEKSPFSKKGFRVVKTPRVGIERGLDKKWRYVLSLSN